MFCTAIKKLPYVMGQLRKNKNEYVKNEILRNFFCFSFFLFLKPPGLVENPSAVVTARWTLNGGEIQIIHYERYRVITVKDCSSNKAYKL